MAKYRLGGHTYDREVLPSQAEDERDEAIKQRDQLLAAVEDHRKVTAARAGNTDRRLYQLVDSIREGKGR